MVNKGQVTGVPKFAHKHTDKPDPWFAWYWSHSDADGNIAYGLDVRPMDIRAWEKMSSIIRPFVG